MATTTNYGWTTPDDTALVKDGAAAIRSLGTAIDTTTYNNAQASIAKTIVDAKGDIIAATAADTVARLAVGANNTVLTADSSTATGLKWAAASSGAMTKITSGTFTTVSEVSVDSCFSSTYKNYVIRLMAYNDAGIGGAEDFQFRFRNNTPSTITSGYSAGGQRIIRSGTVSNMSSDNAAQLTLTPDMGFSADSRCGFTINITGYTGSTERPNFSFIGSTNSSGVIGMFSTGGGVCDAPNIRGFNLKATAGTITGDYQVYGLEN